MSLTSYISKQFSNPEGLGGRIAGIIMNRQNRPMYDETISLLTVKGEAPSKGPDSILDIGCGNGYALSLLARRHDALYAGVDPSESVIKEALKRNRALVANKTMSFSCQSASKMSFADGSFSKAYTINTVYFWDDFSRTMNEIRRVLKPGGLFINTLYSNEFLDRLPHTNHGYKRHSPESLKKAGEDSGFSLNTVPIINGAASCLVYKRND